MNEKESVVLREGQAAAHIDVAQQTLTNWRYLGKGPAYVLVGRAVRYRVEDLDDWLNKHRVDPEGTHPRE